MLEIRQNSNDVLVLKEKRSHTFAVDEYADAGVQILRVAYEQWGKGTVRPPKCFPQWSVYLVHGGQMFCDNTKGIVRRNSILFFPPDAPRGIACHGGTVELGLITFAGKEAETLIKHTIGAGFQHIVPDDFPMLWHRFEMMLSDALSGRHDAHALCSLWISVILQSLAAVPNARSAHNRAATLSAHAKELMDTHWSRFANASAVARMLHVHPSYLYREFKRIYRCTPGQYILRLKMRQAADELVRLHKTIAEVADDYGFSDPFAFSRAFKRVMGEAPAHFAARFR